MTRLAYERRGLLAIQPSALYETYPSQALNPSAPPAPQVVDGIAIVSVSGPLECTRSQWWASYPEVIDCTGAAFALPGVRAVVLKISSPGGEAHGCFEAARTLRAMSVTAGIPLIAYVEDRACSAAYALACAAQRIYVGDSSLVGSIGVLSVREDISARNAAMGFRVEFVTSGARKADGHVASAITADELAAQQQLVDDMATLFFDVVRELRGVDTQPLQAAVFLGASAVARGLADDVVSLAGLQSLITTGQLRMTIAMDKARAALKEAADGDGPDAATAKRALAAMDEEATAEGDEPKPDAEGDEPKPDAEGDEPKPDAETEPDGDEGNTSKKDEEKPPAATKGKAKAAASAGATALAEVRQLRAELARNHDKAERASILATRPDWTAEFRKTLAAAPTASLRLLAKQLPKQALTATSKAALAATGAKPTVGADNIATGAVNSLSARMGLLQTQTGIAQTDHKLMLGVSVPLAPRTQEGGDANG